MIRSTSSLAIEWVKPALTGEEWEFFHHPAKQQFYQKHGMAWDKLVTNFAVGRLVPYPRSGRTTGPSGLLSAPRRAPTPCTSANAKRGYRLNYNKMEDALQRSGSLVLPAPIIIAAHGEALLFSGYRRLCLAWNYGMIPYVWLLPISDQDAIFVGSSSASQRTDCTSSSPQSSPP